MKKTICVERRTANSERLHYNRDGDWLPRLIVWPEYDGVCKDLLEEQGLGDLPDDVDNEWGLIVSAALRAFAEKLSLYCTAFSRKSRRRAYRVLDTVACAEVGTPNTQGKVVVPSARVGPDFFNCAQAWHVGDVVFLMHADPLPESYAQELRSHTVLDRTTLLPMGTAILVHGTEECVLQIAFADQSQEELLVEALRQAAGASGHEVELTDRHFISHWIIANSKTWIAKYAEEWDKF